MTLVLGRRALATARPRALALATLALAALGGSAACRADDAGDAPADGPAYKLTIGQQFFSESGTGTDINLRRTAQGGNTWIGYFDSTGLDAHQLRGGWDQQYGDDVRWSPSLQIASGGFVGGSLNVETGKTWVVGAGYGRTNLQPYFNLNFDPNDAWTLSASYRPSEGVSYSISFTRDDRVNPDESHLHLSYRAPINGGDRLTLDLLYKQGLVNGDSISKLGATITYDWPRYFVRLAYDPNTNFTVDNVVRVSVGTRF